MRKYIYMGAAAFVCILVLLWGTSSSSGPQKTLNALADALDKRADKDFIALMDMKLFAANQVKNLTTDNETLSVLDSLGRTLGFDGVEALVGNVLDMESRLKKQYGRGVATGELEMQCRNAQSPDCPWTAQALREAKVKTLTDTAAVAEVTTQAGMTSRLALRKEKGQWLVAGQAPLAETAERYALEGAASSSSAGSSKVAGATDSAAPKDAPEAAPKDAAKAAPKDAPSPKSGASKDEAVKI